MFCRWTCIVVCVHRQQTQGSGHSYIYICWYYLRQRRNHFQVHEFLEHAEHGLGAVDKAQETQFLCLQGTVMASQQLVTGPVDLTHY